VRRLYALNRIASRSGCCERWSHSDVKNFETKDEKELSKVRITLKDQSGHILGVKSFNESKLLAKKLKLNLIEDKPETNFKYKVFRLVSNRHLAQMEDQMGDDHLIPDDSNGDHKHESKSAKELKRLVLSTKLDENDLMTKINSIKRWLSRGHQISIHVTNPRQDHKILEKIYNTFETQMKGFAKLNQKKIKSDNTLKFMVVPTQETRDQSKGDKSGGHKTIDEDMENMDPNKLLSD